ncbi:MAG: hypothetical protein ACXWM6_13960, partial [Thermodesulfobacteriota bacterium]
MLRKLENPITFLLPKHCGSRGTPDKKALYIQSWVGGVWGGVEKIYRAIWLNVNATIAERKIFVKNYFLLLCY